MNTPVQAQPHTRQVPPLGGFNLTALGLEVRRVLRNRRTVMFILVFPSVFFFMFGLTAKKQPQGGPEAIAYIMISMAVYGAMVGTTSGGAAVAIERSLGWSRQLRLTPLRPAAYVAMKVLTAMTLGLIAIVAETDRPGDTLQHRPRTQAAALGAKQAAATARAATLPSAA